MLQSSSHLSPDAVLAGRILLLQITEGPASVDERVSLTKDCARFPSIEDVRESALELDKISARRSKSQSARSSVDLPQSRHSREDRSFVSALKRQLNSLEGRNRLSTTDGRPQVN